MVIHSRSHETAFGGVGETTFEDDTGGDTFTLFVNLRNGVLCHITPDFVTVLICGCPVLIVVIVSCSIPFFDVSIHSESLIVCKA